MNYQPIQDQDKRDLHNFLREQEEERNRAKQLDKMRDIQESNKVNLTTKAGPLVTDSLIDSLCLSHLADSH